MYVWSPVKGYECSKYESNAHQPFDRISRRAVDRSFLPRNSVDIHFLPKSVFSPGVAWAVFTAAAFTPALICNDLNMASHGNVSLPSRIPRSTRLYCSIIFTRSASSIANSVLILTMIAAFDRRCSVYPTGPGLFQQDRKAVYGTQGCIQDHDRRPDWTVQPPDL